MGVLNIFKTFGLLAILTGLFLGIGYFFGGMSGALIALIFAAFLNFMSYWFSDKIVLRMYRAKEITAADNHMIHQIVNKLSKNAEIPKPKIYLVKTSVPNAFATGRNPKHSTVAVTSGLLEHLKQDEIEGVLAHEISHIKNRDTLIQTMTATIAGAISWLGYAFLFGGRDRSGFGIIFMFILAPLAASLIRLSISRGREYLADESGAKISKKPLSLASALEKIHKIAVKRPLNINPSTSHLFIINPLSARGIAALFSTHPPVIRRIKRLKSMKL